MMKFRKSGSDSSVTFFRGSSEGRMVSACVGVWGGVRGFGQIEIENGNGREHMGKKVKTETKGER